MGDTNDLYSCIQAINAYLIIADSGSRQPLRNLPVHAAIVQLRRTRLGNNHHVGRPRETRFVKPENFSNQSLNPVTPGCLPHFPARHDAQPRDPQPVGAVENHEVLGMDPAPRPKNMLKLPPEEQSFGFREGARFHTDPNTANGAFSRYLHPVGWEKLVSILHNRPSKDAICGAGLHPSSLRRTLCTPHSSGFARPASHRFAPACPQYGLSTG